MSTVLTIAIVWLCASILLAALWVLLALSIRRRRGAQALAVRELAHHPVRALRAARVPRQRGDDH